MNDRTPKLFSFVLTNVLPEPTKDDGDGKEDYHFAFEWFEENQISSYQQNRLSGFVLMEDILSIQLSGFDPQLFLITLKENTKALKNAKGRTTLSVKCNSPSESLMYVRSLNCVFTACN